ncbi:Reverse transcriptase RNA-dependent DNA polymerase [Arabidopsis thaliana x Arabidopsis arenosa]|uniref:Reverse transcriptase RNA-dependent DNA polymerase n=1 Tax=Arabidopsis thaliana x Arabidopsis arenosa TaxID=1240361 RepID=A0A8T1XG40_9BRAS|nr:Reverse transcriptase RNA-dependent DNA polymerase [Arabidopsis thaliana x Arabidopsis arenosa]
MNKVRSMLSESGLGQRFWAEAASTSVYLINRSPSSAIEFKIPEEMWTTTLPDLSRLRRFGCVAYVHSDEGKLNPRAKKGIFTGYPEGVKGFRVWLLEEKRCIISRNVVFREDMVFKDIDGQQTGTTLTHTLDTNEVSSYGVAGNNREANMEAQGGAAKTTPIPVEVELTEEPEEAGVSDYQIARNRPRRQINPPIRFQDYVVDEEQLEEVAGYAYLVTEDGSKPEPSNYQEAMRDADSDKWVEASDEEMSSLLKNRTWDLKEGVDYQEVFSPVVKHVSIRSILSMVVHFDIELQQMDVKTAFLHGYLDEVIYMEQPEGYVDQDYPDKVCLLKKSLYELKQSPRQWNNRFNEFMRSNGYIRSEYESCVYFKKLKNGSEFEMKDLGDARKILGMEITRDRVKGALTVSQEGYLLKVLGTFNMDQCKLVATPMGVHFKLRAATDDEVRVQSETVRSVPYQSAVGSLMYSMLGTRADLAYSVGGEGEFIIRGYCDSDYAGDKDRSRSTTGMVFTVGGNVVSWKSSLQKVVALSTTEANFMALTEAAKEAVWLKGFMEELGHSQGAVEINCDSQSAIALAKNAVFHERTKHISTKFNFIRDLISDGTVQVVKIATEYNHADIFTKVLPVEDKKLGEFIQEDVKQSECCSEGALRCKQKFKDYTKYGEVSKSKGVFAKSEVFDSGTCGEQSEAQQLRSKKHRDLVNSEENLWPDVGSGLELNWLKSRVSFTLLSFILFESIPTSEI